MAIKVLLFAKLAEIAESKEIYIDEQLSDTDELIHNLESAYPGLKNSIYMVAVGKDIINGNTPIDHHSVVALLPPFSGG